MGGWAAAVAGEHHRLGRPAMRVRRAAVRQARGRRLVVAAVAVAEGRPDLACLPRLAHSKGRSRRDGAEASERMLLAGRFDRALVW